VARYYVQCLDGDAHVDHVITFGTPHQGAPQGFQVFVEGVELPVVSHIPVLKDEVRKLSQRVLLACGSTYQILPWGSFVKDPSGRDLDIYADRRWLPEERRDRLNLAMQFQQELSQAGPFPVPMTCWVGYGQQTLLQVAARSSDRSPWQRLVFAADQAGGDVSVPETSAILTGMEDRAHFVCEEHGSLFVHPTALHWLEFTLTGRRRRGMEWRAGVEARSTAVIQLELDEESYAPGDAIQARVRLRGDDGQAVGGARVEAYLGTEPERFTILPPDPTEEGGYAGQLAAPTTPGSYTLKVRASGSGVVPANQQRTAYLVVVPPDMPQQ